MTNSRVDVPVDTRILSVTESPPNVLLNEDYTAAPSGQCGKVLASVEGLQLD